MFVPIATIAGPNSILVALLLGAAGGVVSMLYYSLLSPQEKLKALKGQTTALRRELASYDGDFAGAMTLSKQNLHLSLQSLGCVLWPSLLAGLPVIAALFFVGDQYLPFFAATFTAAMITKFAFRIA
jgi:hypothetical protein